MSTGPFIVTQYCEGGWPHTTAMRDVSYREAFATLEGVRGAVTRLGLEPALRGTDDEYAAAARAYNDEISVNGVGEISIPNGDVIEVEAKKSWHRLAHETGDPELLRRALAAGQFVHQHPSLCAEILAAWNAEHGIGIGERT